MRILLAVVIYSISCPAFAEDAKTALKEYGLVGTWSIDCSKDLTREYGSRITYSVPYLGAATFVSSANGATGHMTQKSEVREAARITEDKIRVILVPIERNADDRAKMSTTPLEAIYEKVGSKLRAFESRTTDGAYVFFENGEDPKTGRPSPLLERCLN